jgi:Response regulator containing CheY-like receiver domain and AraC-type DNA-binding domain
MYKVILVDDEELILEGLKKCVSWDRHGFELIETFTDAGNALDFIQNEKVNVVITDIRMPGIDGLDLIGRISEKNKSIKTIILSGYNEFEYARRALMYGASAYILKPTDDESVYSALDKVKDELDREKSMGKASFWEGKLDLNKIIPENILRDLIFNKSNTRPGILEDFLGYRFFYLLVLSAGNYDFIQGEAGDVLKKCSPSGYFGQCKYITVSHEKYEIVLFALMEQLGDRHNIFALMKDIRENVCGTFGRAVPAGVWEGPFNRLSDLERVFRKARKKLQYSFYAKEGLVDIPDRVLEDIVDIVRLKEHVNLKEAAERIILEDDEAKLRDIVGNTISRLKKIFIPDSLMLQIPGAVLNEMTNSISLHAESEKDKTSNADKQDAEYKLSTFDDLERCLVDMVLFQKSQYYDRYSGYEKAVTSLAKKYVEKNYEADIRLEDIARHLAISVSYFCQMFKQNTGTSFIQYLMDYRMAKAGELIKSTDLRVYEVAQRVGYADSRYFMKLFKRHFGVSPLEMRHCSK